MNNFVADSMAIVLYLENRKLSASVKTIFTDAVKENAVIYISTVSLMEVGYLSEKSRIDISISDILKLTEKNSNIVIHSMDINVVSEAFRINNIPELHDRLITATAKILGAVLITNDPLIRQSRSVDTIW